MRGFAGVWRTRWVLVAMVAFQLVWLAVVALTNSARHADKIPFLLVYSLAVGTVFLFLPAALVRRLEGFGRRLIQNPKLFVGVLGVTAAVVGMVYARFQHIWDYDEELSLAAAQFLATRGPELFFANYVHFDWLGAQHPPLMIFGYAAVIRVFGTDPFFSRLLPVGFMVLTLVLTWALGSDLYDRTTGVLAATLLLAFPLIVRQGSAAMLDMAVTFYFALAMWLVVRMRRAANVWLALGIGAVIGVGMLTKYAMLFIMPVLFILVVTQPVFWRRKWQFALVGLVAFALLGIWLVSAYRARILDGQIDRIAHYIGMLPGDKEDDDVNVSARKPLPVMIRDAILGRLRDPVYHRMLLETYATRLPSAIGPYMLPLLALGVWATIKRRKEADALVFIWIGIVSLGLTLTLPDHRYFMPVFPALAMLMARGLEWDRAGAARAIPLALCFNAGALYLFVDWTRANLLFTE